MVLLRRKGVASRWRNLRHYSQLIESRYDRIYGGKVRGNTSQQSVAKQTERECVKLSFNKRGGALQAHQDNFCSSACDTPLFCLLRTFEQDREFLSLHQLSFSYCRKMQARSGKSRCLFPQKHKLLVFKGSLQKLGEKPKTCNFLGSTPNFLNQNLQDYKHPHFQKWPEKTRMHLEAKVIAG